MRDVVLVVTPSRNAERYLEQTILSVVQQRGEFDVHYHVQDGGSTDSTLAITRGWVERLRAMDGRFYGGAPVHMSWDSSADSSMYDAVCAGFDALYRRLGSLDGRRVVMTWINADDIFSAGAFRSATSFLFEDPNRHWVTGIPSTIMEDGTIADVRDACAFSRRHLSQGWYDGRVRPFLQQEGTFWTGSLWSAVAGLNRRLHLAGDWDLWRRMARHTRVVTLRAVLAHHRRRPGQLSAEMGPYWSEVDALKQLDEGHPDPTPDDDGIGWVAGWNPDSNRWMTYPVSTGGVQDIRDLAGLYDGTLAMRFDFSALGMPFWVRHVSGLSAAEPWGRWSDAALAPSVRISSFRPLPRTVVLRLRLAVLNPQCSPVIITIGAQCFDVPTSTQPMDWSIELDTDAAVDTIDIRPSTAFRPKDLGLSQDSRRLGVGLHTLEIAARREPQST